MNKQDTSWWIKHCPGTTLCKKEDFHRARIYLNKKTIEDGYGLIVSNPIKVHEFPDEIQYRYIISNMINTYTGEIILEPMFEWESYLEQMTIYDRSNIDFYEENFKNIYKMLRPIFKEGDDIREIDTDYVYYTITGIDEDNIRYLVDSSKTKKQITGQCIIKFEDQHIFKNVLKNNND